MTKKCVSTKWETLMKEQRELKKSGVANLHRRAVLLAGCYSDPEYRAWCEDQGTNDMDSLDAELSDAAVDFLTLKAVLDHYPSVEQWQKHGFRELIALILNEQSEARKRENETVRQSWKDRALTAEKECERLRAEVAGLRQSLEIVAGAKCG